MYQVMTEWIIDFRVYITYPYTIFISSLIGISISILSMVSLMYFKIIIRILNIVTINHCDTRIYYYNLYFPFLNLNTQN